MSRVIDLTGQSFGYWVVIERAENNKSGQAQWLCHCTLCDETTKTVAGGHLRGGRSTSCGCTKMEKMRQALIKNEEGKTYGFLHVERIATLEEKPRHDREGIYWNCTCLKCGRKNVVVFGDYLRKGETKSCGCLNSFNESRICQLLDQANINYRQQQTFCDLYSVRESDKLMFDIAIYNHNTLLYLIEYDGIQHFEPGHFNNNYQQTHYNDLIKNKYCFDNNIPLIRIPYDVEYTIDDLKLETTRFLLTPENEQEYYNSRGGKNGD